MMKSIIHKNGDSHQWDTGDCPHQNLSQAFVKYQLPAKNNTATPTKKRSSMHSIPLKQKKHGVPWAEALLQANSLEMAAARRDNHPGSQLIRHTEPSSTSALRVFTLVENRLAVSRALHKRYWNDLKNS